MHVQLSCPDCDYCTDFRLDMTGYTHNDAWDSGFLTVSSLHQLYYQQYGLPNGKPALFLHGGPGGGTSKPNTQFFDPAIYRVVLLDQRGAGKSLPAAELQDNTSQALVADIELIREHLGIPKWHLVFGGSWGSTLSLLYAQTHPANVKTLIVRGIYTVRKAELEFMRGPNGAAQVFPEAYEELINHLPLEGRRDVLKSYYQLLTCDDPTSRLEASRAWNKWELSILEIDLKEKTLKKLEDDTWSLQHARMEAHYEINGGFMEEGQLLKPENVDKIRHIPCTSQQPCNSSIY